MFDIEELREICHKAAGADVALAPADDLMGAAVALEEARGFLEVASAHLLARLDVEAIPDRELGMRTSPWLAFDANCSRQRCQARVRQAERLTGWFPAFDAAACDGLLGWSHVEVLCSVANPRNSAALGEAQGALIAAAQEFPFEHWAALVRQLAADLDGDGSYDPNNDLQANRLRLSPQGDRTVEVGGRFVGDVRATVTHVLESLADELMHQFRRDAEADPTLEMPSRATLMALALHEACRRALAVDLDSSAQPGVEAVVIVEDGADGPELRAADGTRLPDSADVLLTDPIVRGLLLDGEGVPLELGRKRRFASQDQKLALAIRDGGCIFPGCDRPPGWCDAHHEQPWLVGGSTDIALMALLCRHHHVVTHRPGWKIEPDPDRAQRWIWTGPSGRRLYSQRRRDGRPRPGSVAQPIE